MKKLYKILPAIALAAIIFSSCSAVAVTNPNTTANQDSSSAVPATEYYKSEFSFDRIPDYSGEPYTVLNNNTPGFTDRDLTTKSYEQYGKLDYLRRCSACTASIGKDLMPTEKRGSIYEIKPTGWKSVRYSNVDGGSLYNRCHLIGYQLTGENANENNLITGTRYLNVEGMLPFENETAEYIKTTNNHVLYRVTPHFYETELVARGVQMEAYSVEDNGKGICFNVYCYNVQPRIEIDYATGNSKKLEEKTSVVSSSSASTGTYVINTGSKKFHKPSCSSIKTIKEENKKRFSGSRESLIQQGYKPCGSCNP